MGNFVSVIATDPLPETVGIPKPHSEAPSPRKPPRASQKGPSGNEHRRLLWEKRSCPFWSHEAPAEPFPFHFGALELHHCLTHQSNLRSRDNTADEFINSLTRQVWLDSPGQFALYFQPPDWAFMKENSTKWHLWIHQSHMSKKDLKAWGMTSRYSTLDLSSHPRTLTLTSMDMTEVATVCKNLTS